jgi:hypothetical protein
MEGKTRMRFSLVMVTVAAAVALQACGHGGGGPGGGRGGPPGAGGFGPGGGGMGFGAQTVARELQLRRFDADADGAIAKAEFDKVLAADFAGADKNGDGKLGGEETRAFNAKEKPSPDISPIIDWNADGGVSMDEFAAQWRTLFNRADADGDGTVTAEELTRPATGPGGGRPQGGPGGPGGRGGPQGERPGGGF